jgi:hypothetical protein
VNIFMVENYFSEWLSQQKIACIAGPIFTEQFCVRLIIGFSIKMYGSVKGQIIWNTGNLPSF